MVTRKKVYAMLTKEDKYASRWAANGRKKNSRVSAQTGQPYSLMEWIVFAERYLNEAKTCYSHYTPDLGAVRIRLIKAASLLVTALEVHGKDDDLRRLAGVSSSKFPILYGGLNTFEQFIDEHGMFAKEIGNLRSEEINHTTKTAKKRGSKAKKKR